MRTVEPWDKLPEEIKTATNREAFKSRLKKHQE
jgi:hypothetical protein